MLFKVYFYSFYNFSHIFSSSFGTSSKRLVYCGSPSEKADLNIIIDFCKKIELDLRNTRPGRHFYVNRSIL
jgi:hypothetical protein